MAVDLARRDSGALSLDQWQVMKEQARMLVATGFLPASIKTPEQAVAIILKGRELGVPPMHALSNITVIQGKPTCNAELMLALVKRDHGRDSMHVVESTNDACTIEYHDGSHTGRYTFSMDDAKRANLLSNQTWQKYPAAMLRARCISAVARFTFPDSIGGMYTPEELGAPVAVDDQGSMTVLDAPVAAPPVAAAHSLPAAGVGAASPGSADTRRAAGAETLAELQREPNAPAPAAAAPDAYREPTEDEWVVFWDTVKERTGYSRADVDMLLGQPVAAYLRAMHGTETPKTGKALLADLIAHKREGREIPGAFSPAVQALRSDLAAPTPIRAPDVYGCEVCGNELETITFRDGTSWTPEHLANLSKKKHGHVLDMKCYREANAAKTPGAGAPVTA